MLNAIPLFWIAFSAGINESSNLHRLLVWQKEKCLRHIISVQSDIIPIIFLLLKIDEEFENKILIIKQHFLKTQKHVYSFLFIEELEITILIKINIIFFLFKEN